VTRLDIATTGTYYLVVVATSGDGSYGQYLLDAGVWPMSVAGFANLVPSNVAGPATASSGETVQFTWDVGNDGTAVTPTGVDWYDRVMLSPDNVYGDGNDIYLGSVLHTGTLDPADPPYQGQLTVQLPLGITGAYYIFVATDEDNDIVEFVNEGDNVVAGAQQITISLTPYGDLEATNASGLAVGVAGKAYEVAWRIDNQGTGTTGNGSPGGDVSDWTDRVVLSGNQFFGDIDDVFVADIPHSNALGAAAGYDGSWSGNLPTSFSGEYYVLVYTDYADDVYEHADTHSNLAISASKVNIAPQVFADLVVDVTAPDLASASRKVTIEWTVTNGPNGWGATTAGYWYDNIYYSENDVFGDADDQYLAQMRFDGTLNVGEHYDASKEVTIPGGAPPAFYVFVVADVTNRVYEFLYEGNNDASRALLLDIAPPTVDATVPAAVHAGGVVALLADEIEVQFSESLRADDALAAGNYELRGAGPNGIIDGGGDDIIYVLTPEYVDGSTVVTLRIDGGLTTTGVNRLTVRSGIHDTAGNVLDGDGDGTAGGDYVRVFTAALAGDTNHDRIVDALDFIILKRNFGLATGAMWDDGDFDRDGDVDWSDLQATMGNVGAGTEAVPTEATTSPEPTAAEPMQAGMTSPTESTMAMSSVVQAEVVAESELPTAPVADAPPADVLAIAASVFGNRLAAGRQGVPPALARPGNSLPPSLVAGRVGPLPTFPSPLLTLGRACPVVADVLQLAAPWWSGNSTRHETPDEPWMTRLTVDITGKPRKGRLDPIGLDVLAAIR
jgi:hypothetical protein